MAKPKKRNTPKPKNKKTNSKKLAKKNLEARSTLGLSRNFEKE